MNVKLLIIILDREALFHHARLDLGRVNLRRIDYIIGRNVRKGKINNEESEETAIRSIGQV
jgi:hypothetical protein